MMEKIYFKSDTDLCGILETPETGNGRAVVLCHGITVDKEENGIFAGLSHELADRGFAVLRFDFRGHGESGMNQEDMTISGEVTDIDAAVAYMRLNGFQRVTLVGASFGGGPVLIYACQNNFKIEKLVLWNPCLNYEHTFFRPTPATRQWAREIFNRENKKLLKDKGYLLLGSRKFRMGRKLLNEMRDTKPYTYLENLFCPVYFFHGTDDEKVDYRDSVEYCQAPPGLSQLFLYSGFTHGFHAKFETGIVIRDTICVI